MAKKTIPAKTIYTCDRCKNDYDGNRTTDFETKIKLHTSHADFSGAYVGGNSKDIDLCGGCAETFAKVFLEGKGNGYTINRGDE